MIVVHFLAIRSEAKAIAGLLNWARHCPFEMVVFGPVSDNPNYTGHHYTAVFDTGGDVVEDVWL